MWAGDLGINGYEDNVINMGDIIELARLFNRIAGDPLYNSSCDFNKDGVINIIDIMIVARHFNATY